MDHDFSYDENCSLSRTFLQLASHSFKLLADILDVVLMCFFESLAMMVALILNFEKIIKSLWIQNVSFVDLCRFFSEIYHRIHWKLQVIEPVVIFPYYLLHSMNGLDLIFFESPDTQSLYIVFEIVVPIKFCGITVENVKFFWTESWNNLINLLIIKVPVSINEKMHDIN